jgi:hypothetical protein
MLNPHAEKAGSPKRPGLVSSISLPALILSLYESSVGLLSNYFQQSTPLQATMDYLHLVRPSAGVLIALFLLWILSLVGVAIYRLYFSPIAKFPGPKLAALTSWYEFYYDVVLKGQFTFQIQAMHRKYGTGKQISLISEILLIHQGPIVRINPHELHVGDSDYWDELYSRSTRYDKYELMSGRFGASTMTFTTAKSDLHAIRRAPLNPMFSKRSIAKFEPVIREKLELMCKEISRYKETGEILVLSNAFNAFAGDVITQYCFGFSYNQLESPGFKENFHRAYMAASEFSHLAFQFPIIHPVSCKIFQSTFEIDLTQIMKAFPDSITEKMMPDLQMLLVIQKVHRYSRKILFPYG